jgi:hypothetical protein
MTEIPKSDQLEAVYRSETDADGRWSPAPCVICGEETRLRCGGCHAYVCHTHDCPNGCDELIADVGPATRMGD